MIIDKLKQTDIFSELPLTQLEEIARICKVIRMEDGDIILQERDTHHFDIYLLVKGYLEVVSAASKAISDEAVLCTQEDHGIFGEISWLTKRPRTATVRCNGSVELVRIDGKGLERYLEHNSDAGFRVMRRLAIKISENTRETSNVLKQLLWTERL